MLSVGNVHFQPYETPLAKPPALTPMLYLTKISWATTYLSCYLHTAMDAFPIGRRTKGVKQVKSGACEPSQPDVTANSRLTFSYVQYDRDF